MSLLCYSFHVHQKARIFISCCILFLLVFNSGPSYLSENSWALFGKEEEKTMRQTAKELSFICLNILFISEILMIRSSAQVKFLFATLVVHRVYEPTWRCKWRFFLLIQIPFPCSINPELLQSTIVWDSFGPRPGWTFLSPSLLLAPSPVLSTSPAVPPLGSQSSIMEGISLSCGEKAFFYWFLMYNCIWSFFTKIKSPTMLTLTRWYKGKIFIDNI